MILVAGAGPGGLTAALALQRAGLEVCVWERAEELRTAGAGITVQINAMRMLEALGVTGTLEVRGAVLDSGEVSDHRGRTIHLMPFGSFAKRFEQVGIGIHRSELSRTLAEALAPDTIAFSRGVAGVEQDADTVTVVDDAGNSERVEALIGADGIHSVVRGSCFGDVPIRYAGYTCWRGIAPVATPGGPGNSIERWGPGRRFGTVPIARDTTYWFATENGPPQGQDGADPRGEMLERFADFDAAVREVLDATPNEAILRNDIIDFVPLSQWTKGRVTLLGDAAHAMTPNLGQGACQAIEDAVVLAAALREHGVPDGLRAYEDERRPRTERFVVDSYRFGSLAQFSNGLVRWMRDTAFRLLASERAMAGRLDDIYGIPVPKLGP